MKQEGKNNGGESNLEGNCISSTVRLQDYFIVGCASVLQSCFQAPVSYWRVTLCLPVFYTSSFLWQAKCWQRLLQLSVPSPELAQLLNTSSPMHILLHLNHVSTTSEPSKDSCVCDYHAGCENIICSTVSWYMVNYENTSFPWFDSCNIPSLQGCGSAERRMVKSFAHETGHQSHPEFWPHIFGCLQSL